MGYQDSGGEITESYATGAVKGGDNNARVGGLVGYQYNGALTQSYAMGAVEGGKEAKVGGLVGWQDGGSSSITQSYATGAVVGGDNAHVGGLVGDQDGGSITQSYATGAVVGGDNAHVGGLVGDQYGSGEITESYATGAVKGGENATLGGLVGNQESGSSISASFWDKDTTGQEKACGKGDCTVGITPLTTDATNAFQKASYTNWKFGSTDAWYIVEGQTRPLLRAFNAKSSEKEDGKDVYYLSNLMQLQGMAADLDGVYYLSKDIDASATAKSVSQGGPMFAPNPSDIWGGKGFAPIGDSTDKFTGNLDGLGHSIKDLVIKRDDIDYVGLFGYTEGATLRGIGLEGGGVLGRKQSANVGGLVGAQYGGSITESYATGAVMGAGSANLGGLVGAQYGGSITQSYATGAVSGTDNANVGGLVGSQGSRGSITESYATGAVTGGDSARVGGLVGFQDGGGLTQSYATGAVEGEISAQVGGLVGNQKGYILQSYATGAVKGGGNANVGGLVGNKEGGGILQSYATGAVTGWGNATLGGLVGNKEDGDDVFNRTNIVASFWDKDTTKQESACGKGDCTGAIVLGTDAANAFQKASYKDSFNNDKPWDFDTAWYIVEGQTRPLLRAFNAKSSGKEDGKDVYYLSNLMQLQGMAADLDGVYYLSKDIDARATAKSFPQGWPPQLIPNKSDIWGGKGFAPIGKYALKPENHSIDTTQAFTGNLDGLGHKIIGLSIKRNDITDVGLFGCTVGATLRGIGLEGGSVEGTATAARATVGGLVGYQYGGSITQSYATGTVKGGDGQRTAVGGLVGYQVGGEITQSYATGTVTGTGIDALVGGLVGSQGSRGSITQSYATGAVTGGDNYASVGGLVGAQGGSITQSYATGTVTGTGANACVGGLVGFQDGSITQSYATGEVTGTGANARVGGLVGYQGSRGSITESYATGAVTGTEANASVGGLVGYTLTGVGAGNNFWQTDAANTQTNQACGGTGDGKDCAGITGKTAIELKQAATFTDWSLDTTGGDSSKTWRIYEGQTTPLLKAFLKPLTVTATITENTKTYNGQEQSATPGSLSYSTPNGTVDKSKVQGVASTSGGSGKNAGTYDITYDGGLYSTQDGYDILSGTKLGTLTITKAAVTLGIDDVTKTYDGTTTVTAPTRKATSGTVFSGDNINSDGDIVFADKNTGSNKTVTVSGITINDGNSGKNYNVSYKDNTNSSITAKEIAAVTGLTANDKTYDGDTNATLTTTGAGIGFTNMISGDDLTVASSTGAFVDKKVGTGKTVNITGITLGGNDAGNYTLTSNTASTTANINAQTVTVTSGISAVNKTYDGNTNATLNTDNALFSGKITNDNLSATATGAFFDKNAGGNKIVKISNITLGGTDAGNYTLAGSGNQAETTAEIIRAAITAVTNITAQDKTYDGTTTATLNTGGAGFTGMISGDTLTVANATGAFADNNVGTGKPVNITNITLGGNDAGNYTLSNTKASTQANIIAPPPPDPEPDLTITLKTPTLDKTYDGHPSAPPQATLSDGGELRYTWYTDKNGNRDTQLTSAPTDAGQYWVEIAPRQSWKNATPLLKSFTITPLALDIHALPSSILYGDAPTNQGVRYGNFANQQTSDVLTGLLTYRYDYTKSQPVGQYQIFPGGLLSQNYALSFLPGALTVLPRPVTFTANDQSKLQGTPFTFTGTEFTQNGLLTGETVEKLTLASTGTPAEAASGKHVITASDAQNSPSFSASNYKITYQPGTLTIAALPTPPVPPVPPTPPTPEPKPELTPTPTPPTPELKPELKPEPKPELTPAPPPAPLPLVRQHEQDRQYQQAIQASHELSPGEAQSLLLPVGFAPSHAATAPTDNPGKTLLFTTERGSTLTLIRAPERHSFEDIYVVIGDDGDREKKNLLQRLPRK